MNTMSVYNSLDRMDHAPSKSTVRRWLEKVSGGSATMSEAAHHGVNAVREYAEASVTGAALGALNAELAQGLDIHGAPIDLGLAGVALALPLMPGFGDMARDIRTIGATSAAIFTFRKVDKMLRIKKGAMAGEFSGETVESQDPIVAAARQIL